MATLVKSKPKQTHGGQLLNESVVEEKTLYFVKYILSK